MDSYFVSQSSPLPSAALQQLANAGSLDEISNAPGSVRHHIFWHGNRDKTTSKLRKSMLFFVYQTTRSGPQTGFRLCLVHRNYYVVSDIKVDGAEEDDIDRLEKEIQEGQMEMVIVGEAVRSF